MKADKLFSVVSVSLLIGMSCVNSAQAFPKVKVPKVGGDAAGSGMNIKQMKADLEKKTSASLEQCALARGEFIGAQMLFVEALGLKAEYSKKLAEAKALSEGNSSASNLKKAQVLSREANEAIKKAASQAEEMSPESKEKYASGLAKFASGVAVETAQIAVVAELATMAKDIAQNASGLEKAGAIAAGKPALILAAMVPGDVKEALGTLGALISVSKKQGITVPKDATDLL